MTTTPNYGGVLPLVGGDSGTWGTENNTLHSLWDTTIAATPRSYLAGLTLSAAGSSSTFGIAAGDCLDSTNVGHMPLTSAYTKTTSAWSLGTAGGALDTGAIANSTWYHAYLIKRVDTNVVDVLVSLSATAPTLPTNYTLFRRIGSMKTDGSAKWVAFTQNGDEFLWLTPTTEGSGSVSSATQALYTLAGAPTGVKVNALVAATAFNGTGGTNYFAFSAPDQGAQTVSATNAHAAWIGGSTTGQALASVRTNTSAQVYWGPSTSTATNYAIGTVGYIDRRGRDA